MRTTSETTLVDGKKVPNHGHWEYLNENGDVVSKGTFIDVITKVHGKCFMILSAFCRCFYVKGERFPKVIDPEFPELGPLPKIEFLKKYNHIDEIDDKELKRTKGN